MSDPKKQLRRALLGRRPPPALEAVVGLKPSAPLAVSTGADVGERAELRERVLSAVLPPAVESSSDSPSPMSVEASALSSSAAASVADDTTKALLATATRSLPCRETERGEIYSLLLSHLKSAVGGFRYLYGLPGQGKTATVLSVVAELSESAAYEFDFVYINCIALDAPRRVYSLLGQRILPELPATTTPQRYCDSLKDHFAERRLSTCRHIVMLDEIDFLAAGSQSVLYDVMDWPTTSERCCLCVLGVANDLALNERLGSRIRNRLRTSHLRFAPYDHRQLVTIMRAMAPDPTIFETDTLEYCARMVERHGDVRLALEMCRVAANSAALAGKKVSVEHVRAAYSGGIGADEDAIVLRDALSPLEQLFLCALLHQVRVANRSAPAFGGGSWHGASEVVWVDFHVIIDRIMLHLERRRSPYTSTQSAFVLSQVSARLASANLILTEADSVLGELQARFRLRVSPEVLTAALAPTTAYSEYFQLAVAAAM